MSMMSAKYFEYYTIILRGAVFSWTHCILFNGILYLLVVGHTTKQMKHGMYVILYLLLYCLLCYLVLRPQSWINSTTTTATAHATFKLSLGWNVITRAAPSWWRVNLRTTHLNVPLATVHHLYNVTQPQTLLLKHVKEYWTLHYSGFWYCSSASDADMHVSTVVVNFHYGTELFDICQYSSVVHILQNQIWVVVLWHPTTKFNIDTEK